MELLQLKCPSCKSYDIHSHTPYSTKNHGVRVIYQCQSCLDYFSETKNTLLEGLKTPVSMIWIVIKARTDGMGLNAATRTFEFAKNTILSWERKFSDLHQVLFLYTLIHGFIEVIIEGDEAYSKVHHTAPPHESSWWTILLMDRASRFICELDCGTKDRMLFKKAIATLEQIVNRTNDLSLLTDGERRYGNLLFEVCYEWVRTGKRGRPKKTLKRGIRVRIKNKGSQAHKKVASDRNIKVHGQSIQKPLIRLKRLTFMRIMLKRSFVHFGENVRHLDVRQICMPKAPRGRNGFYRCIGWCTILFACI